MTTIVVGTNRPNSRSLLLAKWYQQLLANLNHEAAILDLADLPSDYLVSALYANNGKHPGFNLLRDRMNASDKFVFIVPEYNGSFPGVLKAFIDGLEFPDTFRNKKGALVGLSQGNLGGALALSHLSDVLNYMGMHVLAIKPRVAAFSQNFSEGKISNKFLEQLLTEQAKAFIGF